MAPAPQMAAWFAAGCAAVYLYLALAPYQPRDPGWPTEPPPLPSLPQTQHAPLFPATDQYGGRTIHYTLPPTAPPTISPLAAITSVASPYTRAERVGDGFHCTPYPCVFRAQDGEDRQYLDLIPNRNILPRGPSNVIVEIGAWQGTAFSTSWVFEYALHWRAVHFEPSSQNFERLVVNRPRATNINRAVCAGPDERVITWYEQNLAGYGGGAVGGIDASFSPHFRAEYHNDAEIAAGRSVRTNVTCGPLWRYLDALGLRHIQLFVLDVEGGEYEALRGVRWDMVQVDTWIIEADGHAPVKDASVRALMQVNGYRVKRIGRNDWFSKTLAFD